MKVKEYGDRRIEAIRELISINARKMDRDKGTLQIFQDGRIYHLKNKELLETDRTAINRISRRLYCWKLQEKILQRELSRLIKEYTV